MTIWKIDFQYEIPVFFGWLNFMNQAENTVISYQKSIFICQSIFIMQRWFYIHTKLFLTVFAIMKLIFENSKNRFLIMSHYWTLLSISSFRKRILAERIIFLAERILFLVKSLAFSCWKNSFPCPKNSFRVLKNYFDVKLHLACTVCHVNFNFVQKYQ